MLLFAHNIVHLLFLSSLLTELGVTHLSHYIQTAQSTATSLFHVQVASALAQRRVVVSHLSFHFLGGMTALVEFDDQLFLDLLDS